MKSFWLKLVGLTGPIACGKGVIADTLKGAGYYYLSLSDWVREAAKTRGLQNAERKDLQDIGNDLRKKFGGDILAKLTAADVLAHIRPDSKYTGIVIDGIRNHKEAEYFKKLWGFVLIGITAPRQIRFERLLGRARPSDPKDWPGFCAADARDMGEGEDENGQQVGKCLEIADFVLPNTELPQNLVNKMFVVVSHFGGR